MATAFLICTSCPGRVPSPLFLLFNFLAAPIMLLIVSVSLGALLATFEGWTFLYGFYFVGCNISGISAIFSPDQKKLTPVGEFAEIFISLIAVTLKAVVIGLSALCSLSSNLPEKLVVVDSVWRGIFSILIVIPLIIIAASIPPGVTLEKWDFITGFEYVISSLCGLQDPLTEIEPEITHGRIIAMAVSISALRIISVVGVGLAGAMAVNGDLIFMFEAGVTRCCGCCTSTIAASYRKKNAQPAQGVAVTPPDAPANVELVSGIRNRVPLGLSLDRPAMDDRVPLGLSFIGTPGNGCTE